MNTVIWIVQILIGLAFLMAGANKVFQPKEKLQAMMPWVEDFNPSQLRGIGALEVLGALGVLLPSITGILPWLTPLAAAGLMLVMVGAAFTHLRRKENAAIAINLVLFLLAAFVLYGRAVAETL